MLTQAEFEEWTSGKKMIACKPYSGLMREDVCLANQELSAQSGSSFKGLDPLSRYMCQTCPRNPNRSIPEKFDRFDISLVEIRWPELIEHILALENITAVRLGEKIGVGCRSISSWRRGICKPVLKRQKLFMEVYGKKVDFRKFQEVF